VLTILERYFRNFGQQNVTDAQGGFVVQLMARFDIHLPEGWITLGVGALFVLATYIQTRSSFKNKDSRRVIIAPE
jgi:hypothetical protein